MNGKKLAALAFAVSLAATTLPTLALPTPVTKTVTVQWNTQAIASLILTTQASASQTRNAAGTAIYQAFSGATTTAGCNGVTTGVAGVAGANDTTGAGIINYGNVTPDSTVNTYCLEVNAINAFVATNDTNGYNVTAQFTAGTPAGYNAAGGENVCLYANGTYANNLAWGASARAAAPTTATATTCPASGGTGYDIQSSAAVTLLAVAGSSTTGTNFPADMELFVPSNAATNTVSATLTYTLAPQ